MDAFKALRGHYGTSWSKIEYGRRKERNREVHDLSIV